MKVNMLEVFLLRHENRRMKPVEIVLRRDRREDGERRRG
jgi:hypothetical protein